MVDPEKYINKLALIMLLITGIIFHYITKYSLPRNFRATTVMVYGYSGHGSGSIIHSDSKHSLILTNRHVCEGIVKSKEEVEKFKQLNGKRNSCIIKVTPDCFSLSQEYMDLEKSINPIGRFVMVKFNNYNHTDILARVKEMSDESDLCIVETFKGDLPTIQLSRNSSEAGDKIISIGNPLDVQNHQTDGYVGNYIMYENKLYQQHSGIIYPGNSGGPVVNERGELVGVNTLVSEPSLTYMIPLTVIKKFLRR